MPKSSKDKPDEEDAEEKGSKQIAKKKSSLEEMKENGYYVGQILREGEYCKIRAAKYREEVIAVKIIVRKNLSREFLNKFLPREIEMLSKLNHKHIIKVYKIFDFPERVYIFMEHAEKGDILQFIQGKDHLLEIEARYYFRQMVKAIQYMHNLNIAHRDLKCENIMINRRNEVKIVDFGFCRYTVDSSGKGVFSETYCGSPAYSAPEVLEGVPYNPMLLDVWSLGCVLFIMVTGHTPFDDSNFKKMIENQLKKRIRFPPNSPLGKSIMDLIKGMLEPEVNKRLDMDQVGKCSWLKEQDESDVSTAITGRETREAKKVPSVTSCSTDSGFVNVYYEENSKDQSVDKNKDAKDSKKDDDAKEDKK